MVSRRKAALVSLVALGTAGTLGVVPSSSAAGSSRGVVVVTKRLDAPFGLDTARNHRGLLVAEAESGQVTRVFLSGRKRAILNGVPGVAGVAGGPNKVFAVIGGETQGGRFGPARVVRMGYWGGRPRVIANLLRYELKHNPDGQVQFVNGEPVDAVANPFSMAWSRFGLFVADGGANDVLRINPRTGRVTTFFAPRTFKDTPECRQPDANANPGTRGCDPVPTGVTVVRGSVYVSMLGAEAPGAARIYKLNARTGKVQRVWKGFTGLTGIAVRLDGTIYVSQVLHGAPEGPPPPGFDPADVGRITRIKNGHRTHAQVTMPTGLTIKNGHLHASAWSIASFLGIPNAGQVVKVKDSAFH